MKRHLVLLAMVLAAMLLGRSQVAYAQADSALPPASGATESYLVTSLHGWRVYVDKSLEQHKRLLERTDSVLGAELGAIEERVPGSALPDLKEVPIWIEFHSKGGKLLHYYNNPSEWLQEHGLDPRKEASVELQAADYVNMPHDSLPLLKWLAYGYQQLTLGLHNTMIFHAYQQAKASGAYEVQLGSREYFPFSTDRDYFAVLSAAYFAGQLSYPPYDFQRLKKIDRKGFEMIEKLWKVK